MSSCSFYHKKHAAAVGLQFTILCDEDLVQPLPLPPPPLPQWRTLLSSVLISLFCVSIKIRRSLLKLRCLHGGNDGGGLQRWKFVSYLHNYYYYLDNPAEAGSEALHFLIYSKSSSVCTGMGSRDSAG